MELTCYIVDDEHHSIASTTDLITARCKLCPKRFAKKTSTLAGTGEAQNWNSFLQDLRRLCAL
jgi:dTDP-4-dehydrorhamnose reductase